MKNQLKFKSILYIAIIAGISFNSCSKDEPIIKDPKLKLISNKNIIVPFEDIKVSINVDTEVLNNNYDSIEFHANGTAYYYFVSLASKWSSEDDERDIRITDYDFGKHKVYAIGYKNGIITSKDSIEYEVLKPQGDFFHIKWGVNNKNESLHFTTGLTPRKYLPSRGTKIGGISLSLIDISETKDKEYATLSFTPWTSELIGN